jgi:hypothetical protein
MQVFDFFQSCSRKGRSKLHARVTITDKEKNKHAVIFDGFAGAELAFVPAPPHAAWGPHLPQGSLCVGSTRLGLRYGTPMEVLETWVEFHVQPVPGQAAGVSEQDRLWRAAGGDVEGYSGHDSFCCVLFDTTKQAGVMSLVHNLMVAS